MMLTFPVIYGLILGDFGYGLIIFLLGVYFGTKPFAADPVAKNGITILKWMGVWCMIWGFLFAEGFGFVWDDTGRMGDASPLAGFYAWTYDNITSLLSSPKPCAWSYMHIPFHRATSSIEEYVLLSVYLGVAHLMFGFILGFINVARAHGSLAAFFEKGQLDDHPGRGPSTSTDS
jgi:V/A-type H+-transporting ATPase subunit I